MTTYGLFDAHWGGQISIVGVIEQEDDDMKEAGWLLSSAANLLDIDMDSCYVAEVKEDA